MRGTDATHLRQSDRARASLPAHEWPIELDLTAFLQSLDALWAQMRVRGFMRMPPPDAASTIAGVGRSARECGLQPEQFLWLVKENWAALPEVRTAADPLATREVLSRIITVCIHEFYRE